MMKDTPIANCCPNIVNSVVGLRVGAVVGSHVVGAVGKTLIKQGDF
jgi:hypothetical protein